MRVICRKRRPSEEQNVALGYNKTNTTDYELTIGTEYTVLGLSFHATTHLNQGVVFLLRDDIGRCAFVPICLLDISNAVPSRYWRAQKKGGFDLCLWPEEFFTDYFHDDLSNSVTKVVEVFNRVCQQLNLE